MKRNKLIKLILTALIGAAAVLFSGCSKEEVYRLIKVNSFEGEVSVQREEKLSAFDGLQLISEDSVEVGSASFLELLADSDKHIAAEENTGFVVHSAGTAESGNITIDLLYGKALFTIDNKLNENSFFEVKSPNATLSVRGTSFSVEYNKETGETTVEVFEGTVAASYGDKEELLEKGDTAHITAEASETITEKPIENPPSSPTAPTGQVSLMRMFNNVPDYLTAEPQYFELFYDIDGKTDDVSVWLDIDDGLSPASKTAFGINDSYIEPYMDKIQSQLNATIDDHFFEDYAFGSGGIITDITDWYKNNDTRLITMYYEDSLETIEFNRVVFQFIVSEMAEDYAKDNAGYLPHSNPKDGKIYAVSGIMITFSSDGYSPQVELIETTEEQSIEIINSDSVENTDRSVAYFWLYDVFGESFDDLHGANVLISMLLDNEDLNTQKTGSYVYYDIAEATNEVTDDIPENKDTYEVFNSVIKPHYEEIRQYFRANYDSAFDDAKNGRELSSVDVKAWFPDTVTLHKGSDPYTYKITGVDMKIMILVSSDEEITTSGTEYFKDEQGYHYVGGIYFTLNGYRQ